MEKPASFDLDRALQQWRTQLADSSAMNHENLDELETHLRDSVARLRQAGLSEEEAWIIAEMRFGQTKPLGEEFEKIRPAVCQRGLSERQFIGALLGVFALLTGLFFYLDPPTDLMALMEKASQPRWFRDYLFERFGLALPNAHDCKIACMTVFAFLVGIAMYMLLRDKRRDVRSRPFKTEPGST